MSTRVVTASDIARCGGMSTATRRYWVKKEVLRGQGPFVEQDAIETAVARALITAGQANVFGAVFPDLRTDLKRAVLEGCCELWAVIGADGCDFALVRSCAEAGERASQLDGLAWTVSLGACIAQARYRYARLLVQIGEASGEVESLARRRAGSGTS